MKIFWTRFLRVFASASNARRLGVGLAVLAFGLSVWAMGRKPPVFVFQVQPALVTAGHTLSVRFAPPVTVEKATLQFNQRTAHFFLQPDGSWRALLGVHSMEAPGEKIAAFRAQSGKRVYQTTVTFSVEPGTYPVSALKFTREKDALVEQMERDAKTLDAVYRAPHETARLWTEPFIYPTTGVISSVFGARRTYGNRGKLQPHSGCDIANAAGTPVWAPAPGRVAFAGWLDSFGNSVVLDHGQGVFSYYLHMQTSTVKPGDAVSPSAPLGLMGAEGVATGPHLHWSFVVAGERVNAEEWTRVFFQ